MIDQFLPAAVTAAGLDAWFLRYKTAPPDWLRSGWRSEFEIVPLIHHLIDVLVCQHCGGTRRLLAAIHDPASIRRVLGAMGLSPEVPVLCPARAPPRQVELPW